MAAPEANFIQKINYIITSFMDPCDAPFTIYAEAFFPALLDAFMSLYQFDPMEISTQAFRTSTAPLRRRSGRKGGRGSKAGRGRLRRRAGKVVGFDPNEQVGKNIGKWQKYTPSITWGSKFLWILDGLLQRLVFYWFLAELALEFFYQWMTLVNSSEYCSKQQQTVLLATGDPQTIAALVSWSPILYNTIEKIRGDIIWNPAAGNFNADQGFCMFTATITSKPPMIDPLQTFKFRVGVIRGGSIIYPYYDEITLPYGATWKFEGGTALEKGDAFFAEILCSPGFAEVTGKSVYAQGNPDNI